MYENRWQTHKFTSCNMKIKNHQVIKVDLEASHDILEDQIAPIGISTKQWHQQNHTSNHLGVSRIHHKILES